MADLTITIPNAIVAEYLIAASVDLDTPLTPAEAKKKIRSVVKDEIRNTIRTYRESLQTPPDMSDVEGISTD